MIRDIQQLEAQVAAAKTKSSKIDALIALARSLRSHDPKRVFELVTDTYQRSQSGEFAKHYYEPGIINSLSLLAWYHCEHINNHIKALEYNSEALLRARTINYPFGQIISLYQQGLIHRRIGNYPLALSSLFEALNLARDENDTFYTAQSHRAIANIYNDTNEVEKGLEHCEAALTLFRDLNDDYHSALMLNNLSMVYTNFEDYQKALDFGLESHAIFSKIDSWRGKSVVEDTIAQAYMGMGDYEKAIEYMEANLQFLSERGPKSYQTQALLNMGRMYLSWGRTAYALPYLEQALLLANEIGSKRSIYECHYELSCAYEQQDDTRQALLHLKQYIEIHDDVVNVQSIEKLRLLEVVHRTEQVQAEAEKQRQLREQERAYFERLSQMRDQLISTTSHDLKSPLGAILNYVYLLNMQLSPENETAQNHLERIEAQVDQMRDLIGDLLDLARLETGRVLQREHISATHFVNPIIADYRSQMLEKSIELAITVQPQDLTIFVDPRQMQRVLNNLISNALKYTPIGGRVQVSIAQQGNQVVMSVEDTGIGIPINDIPHIFERFYRVESESRQQVEGTGLGLAIAKSIVEQHRGTMRVRSVLGKGSTFSFTVPLTEIGNDDQVADFAEQGG